MTSLKTSIKTITYLSDTGCLEIQGGSLPGVYTFTFNALTYGGYEMTPVKVTINAVAAETENGEEEMP